MLTKPKLILPGRATKTSKKLCHIIQIIQVNPFWRLRYPLVALSDSDEQGQMKKGKHQPINVQKLLSDDRRAILFSGVVPSMGAKKNSCSNL